MSCEVTSDGRTVWVNNPHCVARFCQVSGEVVGRSSWAPVFFQEVTGNPKQTWESWIEAVHHEHGIEVGDHFKPPWVP